MAHSRSFLPDYSCFQKKAVSVSDLKANQFGWTRFISAYNGSKRVNDVFNAISCGTKHWLLCPEYKFKTEDFPKGGQTHAYEGGREDDFVNSYLEKHPLAAGEKIAVDITGFLRPQLLYLLWMLDNAGVRKADCLYSEPVRYVDGADTKFAGPEISEVRIVSGYEGNHLPKADGDLIVIGCGYDQRLMEYVADNKAKARKVQLFPFPALRPHMYQENRLQTHRAAEAFGAIDEILFAPAHDPFATAQVLQNFTQRRLRDIGNLYLSPLATKAQVLGFGLFYLFERVGTPTSVLFPFTTEYAKITSEGISEIWLYRVELPNGM